MNYLAQPEVVEIIRRFEEKVRGRKPDTATANSKHCGAVGHWLETQMGIAHNGDNLPDLLGFEMKVSTKNKTTFGDWSADWYIFACNSNKSSEISKEDFLKVFGKPNQKKKGRPSWSGEPCPKVGQFNSFGQVLMLQSDGSIHALYSYSEDQRKDKGKIVPRFLQKEELVLARWEKKSLKKKVESKFNGKGWFRCIKDKAGVFTSIEFGAPITFDIWLSYVEQGLIFFDSGMYLGNSRNYSQWRADNKLWDQLVVFKV